MTFDDLVVVAHWELGIDFEKSDLLSPDPNLKSVIDNWRRKLRSRDTETFKQERNLIVTNEGWYGALFGSDLKKNFDVEGDVTYHYPRYKS